jgi:arginine exporter protein ArgO
LPEEKNLFDKVLICEGFFTAGIFANQKPMFCPSVKFCAFPYLAPFPFVRALRRKMKEKRNFDVNAEMCRVVEKSRCL